MDRERLSSVVIAFSRPAAIFATFFRIGVEGGESARAAIEPLPCELPLPLPLREPEVELGEERCPPFMDEVRSRRRVWYAKMEGDGAEGSAIVRVFE